METVIVRSGKLTGHQSGVLPGMARAHVVAHCISGCRIMGKSLLLFLAFSLAVVAPSGVRAATLYGGDYARIGRPWHFSRMSWIAA